MASHKIFERPAGIFAAIESIAEDEKTSTADMGFSIAVDPQKAAEFMFSMFCKMSRIQKELDELRASTGSATTTATAKK